MDIKHNDQILYEDENGHVFAGIVSYERDDHVFLKSDPIHSNRIVPIFNIVAIYAPSEKEITVTDKYGDKWRGRYKILDTLAGKNYKR